jgi:hypothetical protein
MSGHALSTVIEVSNSDSAHFSSYHTRLSVSNEETKLVWSIPDRLLRNEGLLTGILDEFMDEFRERSGGNS